MPGFEIRCALRAEAATLLGDLTMASVNRELAPLVRMTAPPAWRHASIDRWECGRVLFRSTILLFGVLPVDVHSFRLERVLAGEGFDENSLSWMNREWRHERRIVGVPGGCTVTDRVHVTGRVRWLTALLMPAYRLVFRHRHGRLRRRYGALPGTP